MLLFLVTLGVNMRYSDIKGDQKPPAFKSSLASGLVTALLRLNCSLGCKHHRVSAPRNLPFCMTEHGRRYTSHHKHTCLVSRTGAYYIYLKRSKSLNSCFITINYDYICCFKTHVSTHAQYNENVSSFFAIYYLL